jgi:hypothetical protein
MMISHKRKPAWARELIQDGEKYGAPEGTMRKVKKPKPFSSYMALMCDLLEKEPTCFEEAIQKKEWADAMTEEYQSIIKNDVWEIVPRPKRKDVVSSKWLFKIKHDADDVLPASCCDASFMLMMCQPHAVMMCFQPRAVMPTLC